MLFESVVKKAKYLSFRASKVLVLGAISCFGLNFAAHATVAPSDPDYVIAKQLVQKYQCVAGFNSGIFTNKALTDKAFSSLISQCAPKINSDAQKAGVSGDVAQIARLNSTYVGGSLAAANSSSSVTVTAPTSPTTPAPIEQSNSALDPFIVDTPTTTKVQNSASQYFQAPNNNNFRFWGGLGAILNDAQFTLSDDYYPDLDNGIIFEAGVDLLTEYQPIEGWDFLIGGRLQHVSRDYTSLSHDSLAAASENGKLSQTYIALNLALERQAPIGNLDGVFGVGGGGGILATNFTNSGSREVSGSNPALHLETYYHIPVTQNLSITPVLAAIFPFSAPSNAESEMIVQGLLRLVYNF